ncbi:MAG: cation:proton antiporter [Gammaproteobacteria bacterium]|nr:cation:proton antiporter [Gammaproteobacteria bacterium]
MVAIWIACAYACGLLVQRLGLPPLIGFLGAGFGLRLLGFESGHALDEIAHLGVLLLLFTVGLKLRIRNVLQPEVWGVALLHLGITALLLSVAVHFLAGLAWMPSILLAVALGFSSTVLAAKVLEEKRELRAFHGRIAIGILIIQDLVAVALLTATGASVPSPWVVALLALPLARPVLQRLLLYSGHGELLVVFGMLLAVVAGGKLFEYLGLSSELGALVMGVLLAGHPRSSELSNSLWSLKEVFLVGFFLDIGMSGLPDLNALGYSIALLVLLPIKAGIFFVLLTLFTLRARTGFLTMLSLASYSEFGLIVANLAVAKDLLPAEWLVVMAIVVALSFVVSAPLHRMAHTLYERQAPLLLRLERHKRHPDDAPISLGSADVLILGMGRVGTGAFDYLKEMGARVVGLDSDPGKVHRHLEAGRRVVYSDAEDPEMWNRLRLEGVRAILLALPELEAKAFAATQLRKRGFTGLIGASSVFPEEAEQLLASGCSTTFNFYDQAGPGFARHLWLLLDGEGKPGA